MFAAAPAQTTMASTMDAELELSAEQLLGRMLKSYNATYGMGTMSCAVYDTAWVAMISKAEHGSTQWLFPSSFQYLLDNQEVSGGWTGGAAEIDAILNTLAAMLALLEHTKHAYQLDHSAPDLQDRTARASSFLQVKLEKWDVSSTDHVGFEVLVPAILAQIEAHGYDFQFPQKHVLHSVRDQKMKRFNVNMLYGKKMLTPMHSLEAFIGKMDFDRVAHHKVCGGSMMASPSSTAAYLMNASEWDDEAEAYIRNVIALGEGKGDGSVPSAFPSTNFEFIWVLNNLLASGFTKESLGEKQMSVITDMLTKSYDAGEGLMGFASGLEADADDTAMGISALNMLGVPAPVSSLVATYEEATYFKTYSMERNPSFSANCNILSALVCSGSRNKHVTQIEKVVKFVCGSWWESDGEINDKWSLSSHYPTMLMAKALMRVVEARDRGDLSTLSERLVQEDVLIALYQALIRTTHSQNFDGSWGVRHCREETAYAILTMTAIASLNIAQPLHSQISHVLQKAKAFLVDNFESSSKPDILWIEKVSYGSNALSQSYVLAALKSSVSQNKVGPALATLTQKPLEHTIKPSKFYQQLPMFRSTPAWRLQAALTEGALFSVWFKNTGLDIFPRKDMREEKYLDFIPFTWTGGAGGDKISDPVLSANVAADMMAMSALIYQADEFMESVIGAKVATSSAEVKSIIETIFANVEVESDASPILATDKPIVCENGAMSISEVRRVLTQFVHFTINHPHIQHASVYDRRQLQINLKAFLLGHLDQVQDNTRLQAQSSSNITFQSARSSFFDWIRTTSANHTGGPFAFSFLLCLIAKKNSPAFTSAAANYISEDVSRHLATLCRMYNDFGSVVRDRDEHNLNSINFPEFHMQSTPTDAELKKDLMDLAEYERECLDLALDRLKCLTPLKTWKTVKAFCNTTDLYGQMYVVKDLTPQLKKRAAEDAPARDEETGKKMKSGTVQAVGTVAA